MVVHFTAFDDGGFLIEQFDQMSDQPGLRLPPLTEKDEVVACEDSAFERGQDRVLVANDGRKEVLTIGKPVEQVVA